MLWWISVFTNGLSRVCITLCSVISVKLRGMVSVNVFCDGILTVVKHI